jgi:hypothetical protein
MDQIDSTLDALVAALRAHAAAIRSGGDVAAAIEAFDAYWEALDPYEEAPPWIAAPEDYDDGEEPPDAVTGDPVSVRVRADFLVTDREALLAAGTEARRRAWADPVAPPCPSVGEACYELVHDAGPVLAMFDVPGFERRNALLVVHRTETDVLGVQSLAVGEDEEQLFELAEVYGPPPEGLDEDDDA